MIIPPITLPCLYQLFPPISWPRKLLVPLNPFHFICCFPINHPNWFPPGSLQGNLSKKIKQVSLYIFICIEITLLKDCSRILKKQNYNFQCSVMSMLNWWSHRFWSFCELTKDLNTKNKTCNTKKNA